LKVDQRAADDADEAGPGADSAPRDGISGDGRHRPRIELPDGRRAGPHLPIGMGLLKVVDRAVAIGASTIQVFSDNPTAWQRRSQPLPHAAEFRQRLVQADIGPVAIHAAYLINLAGPNDELFGLSVGLLRHELEHANELGAAFVNVHVGSHRGTGVDAGIRRVVDGLALATDGLALGTGPGQRPGDRDGGDGVRLVLENASGGGASLGSTIEEMARILDGASSRGVVPGLRFCLDSAHLWGAGYDVADPEAIDGVLDHFDELIGLDRLAMIHLNDSHAPKGSRHDRHAHLGEGLIGRLGLSHLLCHPALSHVSFYLETPDTELGYDAVNVARLEDLAAGRALTPGPQLDPERGRRARSL
jgi:deoxyribonuclease-4